MNAIASLLENHNLRAELRAAKREIAELKADKLIWTERMLLQAEQDRAEADAHSEALTAGIEIGSVVVLKTADVIFLRRCGS